MSHPPDVDGFGSDGKFSWEEFSRQETARGEWEHAKMLERINDTPPVSIPSSPAPQPSAPLYRGTGPSMFPIPLNTRSHGPVHYPSSNSLSDGDFWRGVGLFLGGVAVLVAVIAVIAFLLNAAKGFSPYVFHFATILLNKAYTGLFSGGQQTFHLLSSQSALLAGLAVFLYLCVVIAFFWVMTTGLGEILGINKSVALGGVCVAPLAFYVVCILALDIGALGQYVRHKISPKSAVASPLHTVQSYYAQLHQRNALAVTRSWKKPPENLTKEIHRVEWFQLHETKLRRQDIASAEVFVNITGKRYQRSPEHYQGIIVLEKMADTWKIVSMSLQKVS